MPLNTDKKQLAAVIEEISGTTPSGNPLDDPTNAQILVEDLTTDPDVDFEESNSQTDSLTPTRGTVGRVTSVLNFTTALRGTELGTFAAGAPESFKYFQACKMKQVAGEILPITGAFSSSTPGTTDAPFRHGELITGGTSGATARIAHDTHNGESEFVIYDRTGTFQAETVTGGSSGAQCPVDVISTTTKHYTIFPISKVLKSVSVDALAAEIVRGSDLRGQTSGARGLLEVTAPIGATELIYSPTSDNFDSAEDLDVLGPFTPVTGAATTNAAPVFLQGQTLSTRSYEDGRTVTSVGMQGSFSVSAEAAKEWKATFNLRGGEYDTLDRPDLVGVATEYRVAPGWKDAVCRIAKNEDATTDAVDDETEICLNSLTFDIQNQLADRICASAPNGIKGTDIRSRAGTLTLDPEATREGEVAWAGNLRAGNLMRFSTAWGSADGNRFKASWPGLQSTQAPHGDRDGIMTIDWQANATGGNNWNLNGASVDINSTGGDNEFVLTYYTTA